MSQQPAMLQGNVGTNGSNTGGTAAYNSSQNAKNSAKNNAEVQSFNEVFGYTTNQNYGFGQNFSHETSNAGIGNSCIHLVTFDATDFINQLYNVKEYELSDEQKKESTAVKFSDFVGLVKESVVDKHDTYYVMLSALLEELPEISFSYEFTEGPGETAQDTISNFISNDIFNACAALGTADSSFKNILKTGTLTNDLWSGVKASEIKLKFKIYTADTLGQTDPDVWIKALSMYASPYTGNQSSIRNQVQNIVSGVVNTMGVGQALFSAYESIDMTNKTKKNTEAAKKEKDKKATTAAETQTPLRQKQEALKKSMQSFHELTGKIGDIASNISDIMSLRFSSTRVFGEFNRVNALGEKLWALYLYDNFLFKRPLTVFVKYWTVKPSQEINTIKVVNGSEVNFIQRPVYYQFELTCSLDQTYSIDQWNEVLRTELSI